MMLKLSSLLLLLCLSVSTFAQNYSAQTDFLCQAYSFRQGTFDNAPYVVQDVEMELLWVYCGPWSGSNNGTINFDIYLSNGWEDLFTMTDYGNGCDLVTDFYTIPAAIWNEAIAANGGSVLIGATITDSCPGGVGCEGFSDPCFRGTVNFDFEPIEAPAASMSPSANSICVNEPLDIADLSSGSGIAYSWNFGADAMPANSNTPGDQVVYYTSPGTKTITLTVSNLLGDDVSTIDIEVHPNPELSTTPDFSACTNDFPLAIEAFGTGDFLWSNNLGNTASVEISPTEDTMYYVELTNEFSCSSVDSIEVSLLPIPLIDAGMDLEICSGQPVIIEGSGEGTLYWSHDPESGATSTVAPEESTYYYLISEAENGCSNTDEMYVFVNPLPDASAGSDQGICLGESITLSASGGELYNWDQGLGAGQEHEVTPETTTTYTVEVTDGNDCVANASVEITVHPSIDLVVTGLSNVPYCNTDLNAYNLLGNPSGGIFSGFGVNGNQFFPSNAGIGALEITYTYEDEFGCEHIEITQIEVELCTGVEELSATFEHFPNPVKNELLIQWEMEVINIEIIDLSGRIVQIMAVNDGRKQQLLNVSELSSGTYIVRLTTPENIVSRRILKE